MPTPKNIASPSPLLCPAFTMYTHQLLFAPIVSSYRPIPNGIQIRKAKRQAFHIITIYALIMYIVPPNQYIITGFWIIMLQSFQLLAAKIVRKEVPHEASIEIMDI